MAELHGGYKWEGDPNWHHPCPKPPTLTPTQPPTFKESKRPDKNCTSFNSRRPLTSGIMSCEETLSPFKSSWPSTPWKIKMLNSYTLQKINMEPENHAFKKENHLPNLHFWAPCCFSRVYIDIQYMNEIIHMYMYVYFHLFADLQIYFNIIPAVNHSWPEEAYNLFPSYCSELPMILGKNWWQIQKI